MRRITALLLCISLLLGGCGVQKEHPELYGYYAGTTIYADGYEISMESVYPGENYLRLDAAGRGQMSLSGNIYDISWSYRREVLRVTLQGKTSKGSIRDGRIYLDYLGMGMDLHYDYTKDYVPMAERALTEEQQWWHGDWYGWWIVDEADGEFADMTGSWWDMCATVSMSGNDQGTMILWDQDGSRTEPLGEVQFRLNSDGTADSMGGYFGAVEIGQYDWLMDPEEAGIDNMLTLSFGGENESGSFYYTIYLRPWGEDWEELVDRPYHYESWYLPLIREGQSMPDSLPQIQ
ncbi:MAG: hypothetical protein IKT58_03240 [Oscillospiraceae bacterium]|nr:hypothetical protein [Oscillospiraceae bacterium]